MGVVHKTLWTVEVVHQIPFQLGPVHLILQVEEDRCKVQPGVPEVETVHEQVKTSSPAEEEAGTPWARTASPHHSAELAMPAEGAAHVHWELRVPQAAAAEAVHDPPQGERGTSLPQEVGVVASHLAGVAGTGNPPPAAESTDLEEAASETLPPLRMSERRRTAVRAEVEG